MFNLNFSVHALWGEPMVAPFNLQCKTDLDNNGLTKKYQNWNYCGNKDTYILDALEVK